jgi:hypothetical protein
MDLIPLPQRITEKDGLFLFDSNTEMVLDEMQNDHDLATAKLLQNKIRKLTAMTLPIKKVLRNTEKTNQNCIRFDYSDSITKEEAYRLTVEPNGITIGACSSRGFLYGAATLIQLCRISCEGIGCVEIEDEPSFAVRGYMLDVSRGRIPKMDCLKKLVDRLALYKINQLQLYMENCLRLDGFEEVWSQTDPFTPQEILELDDYCCTREIELVPCIATFGHLYDLLRSESFRKFSEMDTEVAEPFTWYNRMRYHMINAADPESFTLIKNILDQLIPLFSSRKINICCDETFDLGKGKSASMTQKKGYAKMYLSYVNRLVDYLQTMGKEVLIWGDVVKNHSQHLGKLNSQVTCLNWYYDYGVKEEDVKIFSDKCLKQYVCPSVIGHNRLVNDYDLSFTNIRDMAKLGNQFHAEGLLNTDWGDFGHINMPSLSTPGMIYGAAQGWNVGDDRDFCSIDQTISFVEYGDSSKKLVGMLRELSHQDHIIFEQFVYFRDKKTYGKVYSESGIFLYEEAKKKIMGVSENQLKAAVARCVEISHCFADCQESITEFRLASRGVALMQEFALAIKEYEYGQNVYPLDTPKELVGKLELWMTDYCKAWRTVSRESELCHIKEFVRQSCSILRKYVK